MGDHCAEELEPPKICKAACELKYLQNVFINQNEVEIILLEMLAASPLALPQPIFYHGSGVMCSLQDRLEAEEFQMSSRSEYEVYLYYQVHWLHYILSLILRSSTKNKHKININYSNFR